MSLNLCICEMEPLSMNENTNKWSHFTLGENMVFLSVHNWNAK